jgi:hypothetical protein
MFHARDSNGLRVMIYVQDALRSGSGRPTSGHAAGTRRLSRQGPLRAAGMSIRFPQPLPS